MINSSETNLVFVQPNLGDSRDATSLAVWYTLAKSFSLAEIPFGVADAKRLAESLNPDVRNHLILPSPSSLEAVATLPTAIPVDISVVICPKQFASWGVEKWQAAISGNAITSTRIVTDSEGSRRTIEAALRSHRIEVRVIRPDLSLLFGIESQLTTESMLEVEDRLNAVSPNDGNTDWSFAAYKVASDSNRLIERDFEDNWASFDEADYAGGEMNEDEASTVAERLQPKLQDFELDSEAENSNIRVASLLTQPYDIDLRGTTVGVFGNKLSFIDELSRALKQRTGASVQLDEWKYLSGPSDRKRAEALLKKSDVVIGEWARPNNVWIQNLATPGQRLIVRAHRYEVTTDFPRAIDMQRFDASVVITPWVGRKLVQEFGWPAEKMVYIPNFVDNEYFFRPKLPDARFTLGIVGITPSLKRVDLALDLLSELRQRDNRYVLRIRSALPTEHLKWSSDPRIAKQWGETLARLELDPTLRGAVHFDPPGRDMAAWLQQIGVILSTSDVEGSHVALAEGIASGALPVARRWPGVETLWPEDFIFDSLSGAVEWVTQTGNENWFKDKTSHLRRHHSLDASEVLRAWEYLIVGEVERAQSVFGHVDWHAPVFSEAAQRNAYS